MVTLVTHGIKISVLTEYQQQFFHTPRTPDLPYKLAQPVTDSLPSATGGMLSSKLEQMIFLFSYHISIDNKSEYVVQLLRRHWYIFDSCGEYREVEGEGVVGEYPILAPGDVYEYESACNLTTEIGKMSGTYLMERKIGKVPFKVRIPEFELIVPHKLN